MAKEKEKDPAFLFYSKDWLQGTAGLMPDEKGVYIDLLAHQHQDGSLPNDVKRLARMVGLSLTDFESIWNNIKCKFIDTDGDRLVNRKLIKINTERLTKAHTKAILSRYAILVRGLKEYPTALIEKIKAEFKVSDFEPFSILEATERLDAWFSERLTTVLADGNGDANGNNNKGRGAGEGASLGVVIYDIEKYLLDHPKEFTASLMLKPGMTEEKGKEVLKKCHLWLKGQEKYPRHPAALIATFQSWILNEKITANGTAYRGNSTGQPPVAEIVTKTGTRKF